MELTWTPICLADLGYSTWLLDLQSRPFREGVVFPIKAWAHQSETYLRALQITFAIRYLKYSIKEFKMKKRHCISTLKINGKEFENVEFRIFCEKNDIFQNFSSLKTPWQNGIVERKKIKLYKRLLEPYSMKILFQNTLGA
ncbi:hypothetical protein CR513_07265, partial [Mucuna pruriens]